MARMNLQFVFLAALSFFFALTAPQKAQADSATQARVFYQKGNAAFQEGDDVMAREYYRRSLELQFSFDTLCNLGRSEARSKLWKESYEHLRLCVGLYPVDPDLADAKVKFAQLRDDVRKELVFEEAKPIDDRVEAELKSRKGEKNEEGAEGTAASGEDSETPDLGDPQPLETSRSNDSARVAVSVLLGSVGVVGVGVGTALMIVSGSKRSKADELREALQDDGLVCVGEELDSRCGELSDKAHAADAMQLGGIVGLAAGGGLMVGGVLAYVLWPPGKKSKGVARSEQAATVLPDVQTTRGGGWTFGLRGSF